MRREDLEKLLGGYAAGTLTDEERRALFEAAVSDQELFEKLAEEEPLRDALADPQVRARVRAAIEKPRRFGVWALAAAAAAAAVVIGVVVMRKPAPAPQQVAMVRTEAPAPVVPPAAAPAQTAPSGRGSVSEPRPEGAVRRAPKTKRFELPKQAVIAENRIPPPPAPPPPAPAPADASVMSASVRVDIAPPPAAVQHTRLVLSSQTGSEPRARDLFYRAAPPLPPQPAGTGFAAMNRAPERARKSAAAPAEKGAPAGGLGLRCTLMHRGLDGRYFEVPADTPLEPGVPVQMQIEANSPGYLYVLADGAAFFQGPVAANKPAVVEARPGAISIILTRQSEPGPLDGLLARARQESAAGDVQVDKPAQLRPRDEAIYAVNTSPAPDASVLVEIQLKYK